MYGGICMHGISLVCFSPSYIGLHVGNPNFSRREQGEGQNKQLRKADGQNFVPKVWDLEA